MSLELFLNAFIKSYDRQGLIINERPDETAILLKLQELQVSHPIIIHAATPGMPPLTPELSWPDLLPATAHTIPPQLSQEPLISLPQILAIKNACVLPAELPAIKSWIDESGLRLLLLDKLYILTLVEGVNDFAYLCISQWDETIESAEAVA